jgi:hypothetical protein
VQAAQQLVSYDHGVHLRGTTLWFDPDKRQELAVLTGVIAKLPAVHRRVVASVQLARALDRAGYDTTVLPAAFNRWVGLSGTEVKLVETESPLGAAAALVNVGKERVLVTGALRPNSFDVPGADIVVVTAPAMDHEGSSLGAARAQLRTFVSEALEEGQSPAILVDHLEVGANLRGLLGADGLPLVAVGLLGRLMGERSGSGRPGVTIGIEGAAAARRKRVAYVDSGLGKRARGRSPDLIVPVRWLATASALSAVVDKAKARALFLVGADREQVREVRERLSSRVEVSALSAPRQLSFAPA